MSELLQKFEVQEEEEQPIDLSLLRLDSFNFTSPSADDSRHLNHSPCTACGSSPPPSHHHSIPTSSSSNKRRTPQPTTTSSAMDRPQGQFPKKPKKLFSDYPQTPEPSPTASAPEAVVPSLAGFSKISLPLPFPGPANPTHSLPVFRRCVSDPTNPSEGGTDSVSNSADLASLSPESAKVVEANVGTTPAAKGSAALPPRPPSMLRRSVSDPSPNKSSSRSDSSNDMAVDQSPHFQKLRRLREFFVEGNKLCNELMPDAINSEEEQAAEDEEEDKGNQDNAADGLKPGSMSGCCEEAISVERTGDCLIIHFQCPCGDVYQILLSGESCYYKLL